MQYSIEFSTSKYPTDKPIGVGVAIKERATGKTIKECAVSVGKVMKDSAEFMACVYGLYMGLKLGIRIAIL